MGEPRDLAEANLLRHLENQISSPALGLLKTERVRQLPTSSSCWPQSCVFLWADSCSGLLERVSTSNLPVMRLTNYLTGSVSGVVAGHRSFSLTFSAVGWLAGYYFCNILRKFLSFFSIQNNHQNLQAFSIGEKLPQGVLGFWGFGILVGGLNEKLANTVPL